MSLAVLRSLRIRAFVVVALLVLGVTACRQSSTPVAGRITVDGQAELTHPGEDRREVSGSRDLRTGDRVRMLRGTAVISLPRDRQLELRLGTDLELAAADGGGVRPRLREGDLLVISGRESLPIALTGADVAIQGDVRLFRGVALVVAVYTGTAQLTATGSSLTVSALRQAALPATDQFPAKATPLEYSPADPWDQRYLSDAIELTTQLEARSVGFSAQLARTEGRSAAFFRELFPRLAAEPAFDASLVDPLRQSGETLVGAAVALEAASLPGAAGGFAERWRAVFEFRDEGAPWGLVALDQGVRRAPLLASIEAAIGRGPAQFASGPPPTPPPGITPTTGSVPRPTSTSTTVRPTTPTTPPSTIPPTSPTTSIPTGPLNTGSPLIDDTVNSLVNTLTGLLRSLGQG